MDVDGWLFEMVRRRRKVEDEVRFDDKNEVVSFCFFIHWVNIVVLGNCYFDSCFVLF